MSKLTNIALILTLLLLGFTTADADVSFRINVGTDDYYQPVGDYDYLPYAYPTYPGYAPPRINFHDMMSQYGVWVSVAPFGPTWMPYASNDWRPYTYGHWISTQQYGQMWEGYEPWAWAGYHYGNWIYTRQYGWVWIPGYDWHPGRVTWARSYDSIGWMPSPPSGYDYSRGYLSNVGPNNQFSYNDNDFGVEFGTGNFGYGGPYYDPNYRNMYYNQPYSNINFNLWIFINNANYGRDNYSNYSLGPDYTRHVFDRKLVRLSNRRMDRSVLERILRQKLRETPVEVRELHTDKRKIRVVVPTGSDDVDRIRKHSKQVVRDIIAPGFAEKKKAFKGQNSKNKEAVTRIFHQENVKPKVETLSSEQIITQAREARQNREQNRIKRDRAEKEKLERIEKEGRLQEPKKEKNKKDLKGVHSESGSGFKKDDKEAQMRNDAAKQKQHDAQMRNDAAKHKEHDAQIRNDAAKQKQHDAQMQRDKATQKERDAQMQKDKAKQKERDAQMQMDKAKQKQREDRASEQKAAQGKNAVKQAQTDSAKNSKLEDNKGKPDKNSQQKSIDKKSKEKAEDKGKDKSKDKEQDKDKE